VCPSARARMEKGEHPDDMRWPSELRKASQGRSGPRRRPGPGGAGAAGLTHAELESAWTVAVPERRRLYALDAVQ